VDNGKISVAGTAASIQISGCKPRDPVASLVYGPKLPDGSSTRLVISCLGQGVFCSGP